MGLSIEKRGAVLEITIDRPKANAIDRPTSQKLGEAFLDYRDDDSLTAAIVTGSGDALFSAGWDLKAAAAGEGGESTDYGAGGFAGLTERFDLFKPVIAAVNGSAIGGGLELVLACDIVVCAEHAEFWLPETQVGVLADAGGVQRLTRRLPYFLAMEMLLLGRRLSAREAHQLGLVNHVTTRGGAMEKARELALALSARAPLAVRAIKEASRMFDGLSELECFRMVRSTALAAAGKSFESVARDPGRYDLPIYAKMLVSEDHHEGPAAFAEKRAPRWKGR